MDKISRRRFLSIHSLIFCIFFSANLIETPYAYAADSYESNLGQVLALEGAIKAQQDVCSEFHPELAAQYSAAVSGWKKRNKVTLTEINTRLEKALAEMAARNDGEGTKVISGLDAANKRAREKIRSQFSGIPGERRRELCAQFSANVTQPVLDLESLMKSQLSAIRAAKPNQ